MDRIFDALASSVRRKILAYLSATSLTAGEIAERFDISKPSVSKHLSILEGAGLIASEKKGQFVHYSLVRESLVNTLNGFVQEVCPVSRPIKRQSERRAAEVPSIADGSTSGPKLMRRKILRRARNSV